MLAPTSLLPPLARLRDQSASKISQCLYDLQTLYWPKSRIRLPATLPLTAKKLQHRVPDSGYASAEDDDEELDRLAELRADTFERQFAIKWVTGFVARAEVWMSVDEMDERAAIVDEASRILAAFVNGDADETVNEYALTRSFEFTSGEHMVKVELNDAPMLDSDHTSVGLQSWGSSIILARKICASPADFLLTKDRALRVLELGAGTGLLSIVTAKLLDARSTIVATDYHPDVLANLTHNIVTNCKSASPATETALVNVSVQHLDWEKPSFSAPLDEPFDVILAADVIYHPHHALWIRNCVETLLSKRGMFCLMIPIRSIGRHEGVYHTVEKIFPAVNDASTCDRSELVILEKEDIARQDKIGRADEDGYRLFRIGWA